ncbi:MAG: ATP-dependent RNA helicase HrpA [Moraxellaceae bacterium]
MPNPQSPHSLRDTISRCLTRDQHRLRRRLQDIERLKDPAQKTAKQAELEAGIAQSLEKVASRQGRLPVLSYPDLPVSARADDIITAIRENQVVVLAGETGSGKTTQLPKLALAAGRGVQGYIGHTQPRRIAARSVAARIAEEMNTPLGELVGYKVRFTDEFSPDGFVKLMTDGVLLAELSQDKFLSAYDTLIIDEAHERSLNIDFLLGVLKQLLAKRPDLKLIITSATIDVERFSAHFADAAGRGAPVISVEGRTYPVEVLYRPIGDDKTPVASDEDEGFDEIEEAIPRAVLAAVDECLAHEKATGRQGRGDILVFSSHEREIREIAETLRKYGPPHTEILPLYARLSLSEQQKVFQSGKSRRIVIATNVAETSLTVPNIHYVIDPGFARISRYSFRSKVQRLPIEAVSQAAANQRKGRCGRIAPGLCVRLYSENDYVSRAEFTVPEIQRTNLAAVILQMQALDLGDIDDFPFLDAPDSRFVNDGFRLLEELGAVTEARKVTAIGKQLARFPVDPRIARMLLEASRNGALREVLIIAAALGGQDPRDRPHDKQQAADERHAQFRHPDSDFLWYVNLWDVLEAQRGDMSESQRRDFARRHFLSYLRLREWRETHRQLLLLAKEAGWEVLSKAVRPEPVEGQLKAMGFDKLSPNGGGKNAGDKSGADKSESNKSSDSYEAIHKSLLAGLLSRIAQKSEDREYLATRSQKAFIFPGSALAKKGPPWIMAAELVETQRVYARTVAKIEPEWAEALAGDLLKRSWFEPHWEKRQGRVVAYEQVSLYGLILIPKKKVGYEAINREESREIFIRAALVEADIDIRAPFFRHNQDMIEEVRVLEDKARRRDILIDEESLYAFYDERIPADIANLVAFDSWRRGVEKDNPQHLFLTREYLLARDDAEADADDADFPDHLEMAGNRFALEYKFEPGHAADGVTLLLPVGLLDEVDEASLQWLVPGLLQQKVEALLKNLPKPIRRQLVPVPDTATALVAELESGKGDLLVSLSQQLRRRGVTVAAEDWQEAQLELHCRFNIRVLGQKEDALPKDAQKEKNQKEKSGQQVLAEGRDLTALRRQLREQGGRTVNAAAASTLEQKNLADFPEDDIPESIALSVKGMQSRAYPALVPAESAEVVDLRLFATKREAEAAHMRGLRLLFQLRYAQEFRQLRRRIGDNKAVTMQFSPYGKRSLLEDMFADAVSDHVFLGQQTLVYTRRSFTERQQQGRAVLLAEAERLAAVVMQSYAALAEVQARLRGFTQTAFARSVIDVRSQLDALRMSDFLAGIPFERWQHYPRYLKALQLRLEKLGNNLLKDEAASAEMSRRWQDYEKRKQQLAARDIETPLLEEYRWLLEEYRVSLFAQTVKTAVPVSATRLDKLWAEIPK